jgi:hypothetical protein
MEKKHPLAEVFGFPTTNTSDKAQRFRGNRLCPYNNIVPNCTKASVENPLGVCSVLHKGEAVITCPVRFREDWLVASDAAKFFFPAAAKWTSLTEVSIYDKHGKSAGNIDVVLVSYDESGRLLDYGALEVQAVYISGNVRTPFQYFMEDPAERASFDWGKKPKYPRPDYLSSSRKRLAPQMIFKGGILNSWGRKMAVALNKGFFETLPKLKTVPKEEAELAWLVYDLAFDERAQVYNLKPLETVYTSFESSLLAITRSEPGDEEEFIGTLQTYLDKKLDNLTPAETGTAILPIKDR